MCLSAEWRDVIPPYGGAEGASLWPGEGVAEGASPGMTGGATNDFVCCTKHVLAEAGSKSWVARLRGP